MRIALIACRVLNRELSMMAARSKNEVSLMWLPQGLHDVPDNIRKRITATLNELYEDIEARRVKHVPDYIVLGYGLCSNGVLGIESKDIPIVIPRTDDCIALFTGSQKRYMDLFEEYPGTYWLNNGWIEACGTLVDEKQFIRKKWQEYAEKYGEDNADFLIETESSWTEHYGNCGYISSEVFDSPEYRAMARRIAEEHGWNYREIQGNLRMLRMMTEGDWNEDEFLIVPPRHRVVADYTGLKLSAEPIGESEA